MCVCVCLLLVPGNGQEYAAAVYFYLYFTFTSVRTESQTEGGEGGMGRIASIADGSRERIISHAIAMRSMVPQRLLLYRFFLALSLSS